MDWLDQTLKIDESLSVRLEMIDNINGSSRCRFLVRLDDSELSASKR
jgi:hypothetical protein